MNGQLAMKIGHDSALERAGDWATDAMAWFQRLGPGALVTAEDLRLMLGDPPNPNALGAVFKAAEQSRLIVADGFQRSTRAEARGRVLVRWRSV